MSYLMSAVWTRRSVYVWHNDGVGGVNPVGNPAACFVPAGEKSEAQKQEPVLGARWLAGFSSERNTLPCPFNLINPAESRFTAVGRFHL